MSSNGYETHRSKVEGARRPDGKFGEFARGEVGFGFDDADDQQLAEFEQIAKLAHESCARYSRKVNLDHTTPEDLAQDTLIDWWQARSGGTVITDEHSWVRRVAFLNTRKAEQSPDALTRKADKQLTEWSREFERRNGRRPNDHERAEQGRLIRNSYQSGRRPRDEFWVRTGETVGRVPLDETDSYLSLADERVSHVVEADSLTEIALTLGERDRLHAHKLMAAALCERRGISIPEFGCLPPRVARAIRNRMSARGEQAVLDAANEWLHGEDSQATDDFFAPWGVPSARAQKQLAQQGKQPDDYGPTFEERDRIAQLMLDHPTIARQIWLSAVSFADAQNTAKISELAIRATRSKDEVHAEVAQARQREALRTVRKRVV